MNLESYFIGLLNVSITATYVAAAVLILRIFIKKIPKWAMCVLWSLVGLRILLPFTPESPLSLLPSAKTLPDGILTSKAPAIDSGLPVVDRVINPVISKTAEGAGVGGFMKVASVIWAVGAAAMLIYSVVVYVRLRLRVRESVPAGDGVYICDRIEAPFLFGFIKPKIYIPSGLSEEDASYVIAHEESHMKRFDHVWKPAGFFLLSLHWFNPALWVAYILLCRDIEYACDEKVIAQVGAEHKKAYSTALVNCSVPRRMISACPVAFGETGVKERVVNVLHYKKPAFWIIAVSVVATVVISVCFLTNPVKAGGAPEEPSAEARVLPDRGEHNYIVEIIHAPGCKSGGSARYTCRDCGESFVSLLGAAGHSYTSEVTTRGDCVTAEITTYTCERCGDSYEIKGEAPRGEHEYESAVTVEPNCSTREVTTYTCVHCGDSYDVEGDFAPDMHNYVFSEVAREATCLNGGLERYRCSDCGAEYVNVIPKADHEFTPVSDENCYTCAICGTVNDYIKSSYENNQRLREEIQNSKQKKTSVPIPNVGPFFFNGFYYEINPFNAAYGSAAPPSNDNGSSSRGNWW